MVGPGGYLGIFIPMFMHEFQTYKTHPLHVKTEKKKRKEPLHSPLLPSLISINNRNPVHRMKDQEMGSDQFLPISSPKLPIYSLPVKKEEPPGMLTPPLQAAVSVPFEWEEAPGKPRAWNRGEKARSARCLDLPPRMSARVKISDVCSPTTVLEGPYVGRSVSFGNGGGKSDGAKERSRFGSSRWMSLKENGEVGGVRGGDVEEPGGSVAAGGGGEKETKVKITRMTRKGSFLGMSSTRSHLWVSTQTHSSPLCFF